jgi:plastin-1
MQNAKYVISVARKMGCNIFVVWEDIVELKQKRIVCLVGEIIAIPAQ